jgi:hypothetical protein
MKKSSTKSEKLKTFGELVLKEDEQFSQVQEENKVSED